MVERIAVTIDADLSELVPGFLDNRHKDVHKLATLLAQRDFAAIRIIGHSLKGVGGGYGFDAITELGGEIERAAIEQDEHTLTTVLEQLRDYLARVDVTYQS